MKSIMTPKVICWVKDCIHNKEGNCTEEVIYIRDISNRCMNCIEQRELPEDDVEPVKDEELKNNGCN